MGQQICCPIPDMEGLSEGSPAQRNGRVGGFFTKENPTGLQELAMERTQERGESKKRAASLEELWTESQRA